MSYVRYMLLIKSGNEMKFMECDFVPDFYFFQPLVSNKSLSVAKKANIGDKAFLNIPFPVMKKIFNIAETNYVPT